MRDICDHRHRVRDRAGNGRQHDPELIADHVGQSQRATLVGEKSAERQLLRGTRVSGAGLIGLSVDPVESHLEWEKDIEETQGTAVNFPMIADPDHGVSDLYDMIQPNASDTLTVRSVFVIGADNKVKLILTYPASTGRNFVEILRVIDSLQLTANHKVATPVNWKNGEDVIIVTAVSNEEATEKYGSFTTVKPYLRTVPQPT